MMKATQKNASIDMHKTYLQESMARGNWLSRGKGKGKHQGPRRVDMAWESEKEKMHTAYPQGNLAGKGRADMALSVGSSMREILGKYLSAQSKKNCTSSTQHTFRAC